MLFGPSSESTLRFDFVSIHCIFVGILINFRLTLDFSLLTFLKLGEITSKVKNFNPSSSNVLGTKKTKKKSRDSTSQEVLSQSRIYR